MFLEVEVWGKVKPDIGKNYSILANGKEAVYSRLAVSVVPVVPVEAHDNEGQVGLEGSRFVRVAPVAFVLDLRPEVVAEKHVALRAEYEGDEGTLMESEVLFRGRKAENE